MKATSSGEMTYTLDNQFHKRRVDYTLKNAVLVVTFSPIYYIPQVVSLTAGASHTYNWRIWFLICQDSRIRPCLLDFGCRCCIEALFHIFAYFDVAF